ncbi:MAG: prephenate dehydrogenase/arogenate dehydrogenase family protein [Rhodocyclaceae bacterium]|nr:prephenate dehydrogenase/arogenate dehydrogenase family protein [Rhodocyclaceae bacterium]
MAEFNKVVICGVGLIGGSFARALREAGVVGEVVGVGRSAETLKAAVELGVIDSHTSDWKEALADADLVLLATPVGQMETLLSAMLPFLPARTLITDGGSTKQNVVEAARRALGDRIGQFVPGHPIAGGEKSGVAVSDANLYRGRRVVLTPLAENTPESVETVRRAWRHCGALVSELTPEEHDRVFAAVSHLPHLLAFALVHELTQRDNAQLLFGFAASGFRDFTRIANSHPEMWRDICIANQPALLSEMDAYMAELQRMRDLLAAGDAQGLEEAFSRARNARTSWLATANFTLGN